jgi:hypothetical protein
MPDNKIKIRTITPANSDGNELKNYYFLPAGNGTYNFYAPNDNLLWTGLAGGIAFNVQVAGKRFSIAIYSISDTAASGVWSDLSSEELPGSGTFQAQAGGTGDPEPEKSASSATA